VPADHLSSLTSLDDVKLLNVQLNRLRRWLPAALIQSTQRRNGSSTGGHRGRRFGRSAP
jgi:hypothetical protein